MSNQYLELLKSRELSTFPHGNILLLPARRDDWTKQAIDIARAIPTAQVYVGHRKGEMTPDTKFLSLEYSLNHPSTEMTTYNHETKLDFPRQTQITISSKLTLMLQQTKDVFSDNSVSDRVHQFGFELAHIYKLPFPEQFFDLSITQTPQTIDTMHLAYRTKSKPRQLFQVMKNDSFWIHFNTGFMITEAANPYFERKNELDLEKLDNDLLKTIHKGGLFLKPRKTKYDIGYPISGEVVNTTGNNFELYKRRAQFQNLKN